MTHMDQARLTRTQRQYAAIVDLVTDQSVLNGGLTGAARLITETAAEALDVERVSVWLLSDDRTSLRCVDLFERTPMTHAENALLDARNYPRYFDALAAGRAVDAHDARTDPRTNEFTDGYLVPCGITSMLDAPIRVSGEVVGIVCHEHVGPMRRWMDDEVSFAAQIADQAAQALVSEDRKMAEEAIRREVAFRNQIIEHAAEGMCMCHSIPEYPYVAFTVWNSRMTEIMGYTMDQINRLGWYQTAYPEPELRKQAIRHMASMREGDDLIGEEWEVTRADGEKRILRISTSVVGTEGDTDHIFAVMQDITEQKEAEQQLRQRDAEMAHMNRLHTVGEMAGELAHEFNQPLYAINNYVRGIQRHLKKDVTPDLGVLSDAMEHVSTEVMRASGIIRRLREFVRGREPRRSSVDVDQLLCQAVDLLQPLARDKCVTLKFERSDGLPLIQADPVQIEQVVVNLVANAIDAVSDLPAERRAVTLGSRLSDAGVVEIVVQDHGKGIAKELEGSLFETFTTTKEGGLGVGLAISRSIVHSHGGKIWFVHNEPHGAAFHFTLPRHQEKPTLGN